MPIHIGQQIKQLRLERGLTQQELALQSGLSFSFINQLERGKQSVRLDAVDKLAELFGYEVSLVKQSSIPAGMRANPDKTEIKE